MKNGLHFHEIYRPSTARLSGRREECPGEGRPGCPAGQAETATDRIYREYLPGSALAPYICCYWVMEGDNSGTLIIPDTCMDIIVKIDRTKGTACGHLCGIQDRPLLQQREEEKGIVWFAVRFYFWAAHLFVKLDFSGSRNGAAPQESLGREWGELISRLPELENAGQMIACTEEFLWRKLIDIEYNPCFFNVVERMLEQPGRMTVRELCEYACVSQRQVERIFQRTAGLSVKKISSLIRYQNVWRDMSAFPGFDIQDSVFRYGYVDEAHLLNEFRKYHGVSPEKARKIAQNAGIIDRKNVDFLQD